jgi:hypothetical protein
MNKSVIAGVILSTGLGLAACAPNQAIRQPVVQCAFPNQAAPAPGRGLVAQEYGAITPIPLDAVQFTNQRLSKQLAVQFLQARRTETNTVQVTARMINCTDSALVVGVRTNFMDKEQAPTEAETIWQNVILQPRSMGTYQESSLSKAVEFYVVELRNAGSP